jgi:trehalose/maltose transport system substrate-binding protein
MRCLRLVLVLCVPLVHAAITLNILEQTTGTLDSQTLQQELTNFTRLYPNIAPGFVPIPHSTDSILNILLNNYLKPQSPKVDLFPADVVWTGDIAPYAVDMHDFDVNTSDFTSASLASATTPDGRLVAVPWFIDYPLLFYRKDLLQQYFNSTDPPQDWDTLEYMAGVIQAGERKNGNFNFYGFIWQGKAYEGLTCNILEWIHSHGGGSIIDPDTLEVTIRNDQSRKALLRAMNWIGEITPFNVVDFDETATETMWLNGNAAFMRNWLYAITDSNQSPLLSGNVGIALLPKDVDQNTEGTHTGTLGGWNMAISRYTANIDAAVNLSLFLTSSEQERFRFEAQSSLPARSSLLSDPQLCQRANYSFITECDLVLPDDYIVARPSALLSSSYEAASKLLSNSVNSFLSSETIQVDDLLLSLECGIAALIPSTPLPPDCITEIQTDQWVVVFSIVLCALGCAITIIALIFLFVAWDSPIVKASSQVFMLFLWIGVLFVFLLGFLFVGMHASPATFRWGCSLSPYLQGLSFSLVVGSLAIKTYQVYFLVNSATTKFEAKVIPTSTLLQYLFIIFLIDSVFSFIRVEMFPETMSQLFGNPPSSYVLRCINSSPSSTAVIVTQDLWRGTILLLASFMAFKARNVPVHFNETRSLGFVIYNICFLGALYVAMGPIVVRTGNYELLLQILCLSVPMYVVNLIWFGLKFHAWWNFSESELRAQINADLTTSLNASRPAVELSRSQTQGNHFQVELNALGPPKKTSRKSTEERRIMSDLTRSKSDEDNLRSLSGI